MSRIYKKKIHLERPEAYILGVLVILVAGMNFILGFMYGMKRSGGVVALNSHGATEHGERSPASVAGGHEKVAETHTDEIESKAEMMKVYENSKKFALEETLLKQQYRVEPKSISDLKADMYEKQKNGREPAEAENLETKSSEAPVPEETVAESAPEKAVADELRGPSSSSVKSLFEQGEEDRKVFIPTPDHWTIQVGSYPTKDQAQAKLDLLLKGDVAESYIREKKVKGNSWYSVFVGSHSNKQWSERLAKRLIERKLIEDYIVDRVP